MEEKAIKVLEIIWKKRYDFVSLHKSNPNIIIINDYTFECLKRYLKTNLYQYIDENYMVFTNVRLISSKQLKEFEVLVY